MPSELQEVTLDLTSEKYEYESEWGCRYSSEYDNYYITFSFAKQDAQEDASLGKFSSFVYLYFDDKEDSSCIEFKNKYKYSSGNSVILRASRIQDEMLRYYKVKDYQVVSKFGKKVNLESYSVIDSLDFGENHTFNFYSENFEYEGWGCRTDDSINMTYLTFGLSNMRLEGYGKSKNRSSFIYIYFEESEDSDENCEQFMKDYMRVGFLNYNYDDKIIKFMVKAQRIKTSDGYFRRSFVVKETNVQILE